MDVYLCISAHIWTQSRGASSAGPTVRAALWLFLGETVVICLFNMNARSGTYGVISIEATWIDFILESIWTGITSHSTWCSFGATTMPEKQRHFLRKNRIIGFVLSWTTGVFIQWLCSPIM